MVIFSVFLFSTVNWGDSGHFSDLFISWLYTVTLIRSLLLPKVLVESKDQFGISFYFLFMLFI
jgi:hypothetical protein